MASTAFNASGMCSFDHVVGELIIFGEAPPAVVRGDDKSTVDTRKDLVTEDEIKRGKEAKARCIACHITKMFFPKIWSMQRLGRTVPVHREMPESTPS